MAERNEEGRPICELCLKTDRGPEIKEKEIQYWREVVGKRSALAESGIAQIWVIDLWRGFIRHECEHVDYKPTALRLMRYVEPFKILDTNILSAQDLLPSAISSLFSSDAQRRYAKVFVYLTQAGFASPSAVERLAASEEARIQVAVNECDAYRHFDTLNAYVQYQRNRNDEGRTSIASIRLNVRAAVNLLKTVGDRDIAQVHVNEYLRASPGQRAALSGFVGFLRKAGTNIRLPVHRKSRKKILPPLADDLLQRLADGVRSSQFAASASAMAAYFVYALGLPFRRILALNRNVLQVHAGHGSLELDGLSIPLDPRICSLAMEFVASRDSTLGASEYLFPGRTPGHSLSESTVAYHLKKWGTSPLALRASASQALREFVSFAA